MSKPRLFYTIGEHTDISYYCKRKGLIPKKFEIKELDGRPFKSVSQYVKGNFKYEVLEADQCYSGYMVTLVRLPRLSYEDLLKVALTSRYSDERAGAIGTILKDYTYQFQQHLMMLAQMDINALSHKKYVRRMLAFIKDLKKYTSYVWQLDEILLLCEKIYAKIR